MTVPGIDPDDLRALMGADYEVQHLLGQGAYGTVVKAIQRSTGQPVAIKAQRLGREQSPEQRASLIGRFERETLLCATLNHPAIVRIIDKGRHDDVLIIIFEFVPGETLTEHLARRRSLPPVEAVFLMAQVLDALETAHQRGIVHRDLKPDNIMVVTAGAQSYMKVLDFGIGAYTTDAPVDAAVLTRSQEILGTPCYGAPEQLRGEPATARSDIYAWGLVLLECLTGQRVMDGATMAQVFHKQLSATEVPLPPALATHPLGDIVRQAVAKDARHRAGDAGRLGELLRRVRIDDFVGLIAAEPTGRPVKTMAIEQGTYPGEQRQATVFCCSVTALSTGPGLPDVETYDTVQRDQLGLCTDIVTRFGGHLVGRLANRIVAVFGLPQASDSDARRACRAALELSARMESRRAILSSQRGIDLELRIGIHTDMVIVDVDGTPAGPAVNLASRLESLAIPGAALVSAATRDLVHKRIRLRSVDPTTVASVPPPVKLFTLISEGSASDFADLPSDRRQLPPLVGRDQELETLLGHWGAARAGAGRVTIIRGEPGVGKSRLIQELRQRALETGALVLACHCLQEERNSALHPVLACLRQHFELDGGASETSLQHLGEALARCQLNRAVLTPILCSWMGVPAPAAYPPPPLSGERQRDLLLQALARLLCQASTDEPKLIIVEDLHWADPSSLELVSRIAEQVAGSAALVLLTARPELEMNLPGVDALQLSGLPEAAIGQLITHLAGAEPLDAEMRASIMERTDGVPLFVEELTRSLLNPANTPVTGGGPAARTVPSSLQDLLNGRLDGLGVAKETAQLAAAIGREFEVELLDAISLRGREALQADLNALVDSGMVHRRLHASVRYVFRHALIREAAAESMLAAQRRVVHRRIAVTLEGQASADGAGPEPARLAWHYSLAGEPEKAIPLLLTAGQRAARAHALREAAEHLRAGLGMVTQLADPATRDSLEIDLLNALGGILIATEGLATPTVVKTFSRSFELVRAGAASALQSFGTLRGLWTFHNARADYAAARELAHRLLELAATHDRPDLHLGANECAVQTALLTGELEAVMRHAAECERRYNPELQRELFARFGEDPWLTALSFECIATTLRGFPDRARAKLALLRTRADALGVPTMQAVVSAQWAWVELLLSACVAEPDECRVHARASAEEAVRDRPRGRRPLHRVLRTLAGGHGRGVEWTGSRPRRARPGAAVLAARRLKAFKSWPLAFRAHGLLVKGDVTGAAGEAQAALDHCRQTGEAYGTSEAYRMLGLAAIAEGGSTGWERGVGAFEEAIGTARLQGARWLTLRAAFSYAHSAQAASAPAAERERSRARLTDELRWFEESREGLETPLVRRARLLLA